MKEDQSFLRFLWPDGDIQKKAEEYCMAVHLFGAGSSPACANYYALRRTADDNEGEYGVTVSNSVTVSSERTSTWMMLDTATKKLQNRRRRFVKGNPIPKKQMVLAIVVNVYPDDQIPNRSKLERPVNKPELVLLVESQMVLARVVNVYTGDQIPNRSKPERPVNKLVLLVEPQ